jgi:hypothetical protein
LLINSILVGIAFGIVSARLRDMFAPTRVAATSAEATLPVVTWKSREIRSESAS